MYRPCNVRIENTGIKTVLKQQWLIMKKSNRYEHPHKATITDTIREIKKFQKEEYEIVLAIDDNEAFTNAKGGIAKMYKECKLYARTKIMINKNRNSIYEDQIKLIFYFAHTIY